MIDTIFWSTGLIFWGTITAGVVIGALFFLYFCFMATLDIASQYFLLYMEKREAQSGMTWLVWWTSYEEASWNVIFYRIKRAFGKATQSDDPRLAHQPRDDYNPGG